MQKNSNGQPTEKEIICISWQSKGQPERATDYYHASCYNRCPIVLPDGEKRKVSKDEVADYITCSSCGCYINF